MDQLFLELIGKPKPKSPKLITVVAENFSIFEDQARFLKTTLAIPLVKQLPLDPSSVRLIQLGPTHCEIQKLIDKAQWIVDEYDSAQTCDQICKLIEERYLQNSDHRYLLFFNNLSLLELTATTGYTRIVKLLDKLKRVGGHFVIAIYQNNDCLGVARQSLLLRDLEYISDAYVSTKLYGSFYYQVIWHQTIPEHRTLLPGKVDTSYYTCKIGKFYYSPDLLCFYERKKVDHSFDPNAEKSKLVTEGSRDTDEEVEEDDETTHDSLRNLSLEQERSRTSTNTNTRNTMDDASSTLPYTRAQDPERSRIFYYPERDEDPGYLQDDEDPDNDLDI